MLLSGPQRSAQHAVCHLRQEILLREAMWSLQAEVEQLPTE